MDTRGQFTFYASIFESAKRIRNKSARADFYDAVCDYALNGVEPNLEKLSDAAAIGFISAKPNLDASRKKAKSGKAGGSSKQTASKPQANDKQSGSKMEANDKQTVSEKEKEKEIEIEVEKENECYKAPPALLCDGKCFTSFFDAYPNKRKRDAAWEEWKVLNPAPETVEKIMSAVSAWKQSTQWLEDGGRFIPLAVNFLHDSGYWLTPPTPAPAAGAPRQLDEDEVRAIQRMIADDVPL